jgi:type I restriction enzyme S subunit
VTEEWRTVTLGDAAEEVTVGHVGPMAAEYVEVGVPFLRSLNILPHRIDIAGIKFVSPEFHSRLKKSSLKPGDVVTVRTGKPGTTAVIPAHIPEANCSDVVITRPGAEIDARWLSYYINGVAGGYISSRLVGAVQQHFNVGSAKEMVLALPPLKQQRGIAATLGALDDKIESNRRVVGILEETLRIKFRCLKMTEPCNAVPLSEVANITKGVSYKSADLQPSTTSLVTLKSFDRTGGYKVEGLKPFVGKYKPEQVIEPGEIVIAQTDLTQGAEVVGRAARVPSDSSADTLVASLDLVVIRPQKVSREYLLGVLTDEDFRQHCRSRVNGTTVLHLASDAIPTYAALVASPVIVQKFTDLARPLLELVDSRNRENRQLASLRNALLPELLSGRIRVPEAEEAVAEVIA